MREKNLYNDFIGLIFKGELEMMVHDLPMFINPLIRRNKQLATLP